MRLRITRALAALTAGLVLALAVGSAAANTLSYSEQRFRIVWTSLTFSEAGGGLPIRCPVTLVGSFHEHTVAKAEGTLVAAITGATLGVCQEGNATILEESLPWHVLYESYTGLLPNITSVRHYLIGAAFQIEPGLGIVCLARTSEEFPAGGDATRESEGAITSLTTISELAIPVTGSPQCPEFGIFTGSGEVYALEGREERERVTLTLV
jgi:hypothetical protein